MATRPRESPDEHLRRVLHEYGVSLRRMATSWTRNAAERDDLVQDIALSLLTSLPHFRGDCPERAFVWRVAHNRALASAARRRRDGVLDPLPNHELGSSPTPPPDEAADLRQRAEFLHRALRSVKDDFRVVLVLSMEGLSHEEIAVVVGISTNAVGVRLHRAREALLRAYEDTLVPASRTKERT